MQFQFLEGLTSISNFVLIMPSIIYILALFSWPNLWPTILDAPWGQELSPSLSLSHPEGPTLGILSFNEHLHKLCKKTGTELGPHRPGGKRHSPLIRVPFELVRVTHTHVTMKHGGHSGGVHKTYGGWRLGAGKRGLGGRDTWIGP